MLRWLKAVLGLAVDLAKPLGAYAWSVLRPFGLVAAVLLGVGAIIGLASGELTSTAQVAGALGLAALGLTVVISAIVSRVRHARTSEARPRIGVGRIAEWFGEKILAGIGLAILVGAVAGVSWCVGEYQGGREFLGLPYLGAHICEGRLQETLGALAPERDPKVEKCRRLDARQSGGAADPQFMCFVRMLDRGVYKVSPCQVSCAGDGSKFAERLRRDGFGIELACPSP